MRDADADTEWLTLLRGRFAGRQRQREYIINVCPYCGNSKSNFEVNIDKLVFKCWVCLTSGTVRSLFFDFNLSVSLLPKTHHGRRELIAEELENLTLPPELLNVLDETALVSNWARKFLENRGLTRDDVVRYKIQYAMSGKYAGRIIWPLYEGGKLVYFVARRFMDSVGRPYTYPEFRRRNLCSVFLGREQRMTLVLVEGVFQVPSLVRLGYSVMPLLGTGLSKEQIRKLQKRNFDRYVVLLDNDAIKKSILMAQDLKKEGLNAIWTDTGGPDSDEIAPDKLRVVVETAKEPTLRSLVELRLQRVLIS